MHWAPSWTIRVLVLAGARRCALKTCGKKSELRFYAWLNLYIIFTIIYSSLHGFIWNQHIEQLLIGLLAQTVEHGTDITEVVGSNPLEA